MSQTEDNQIKELIKEINLVTEDKSELAQKIIQQAQHLEQIPKDKSKEKFNSEIISIFKELNLPKMEFILIAALITGLSLSLLMQSELIDFEYIQEFFIYKGGF